MLPYTIEESIKNSLYISYLDEIIAACEERKTYIVAHKEEINNQIEQRRQEHRKSFERINFYINQGMDDDQIKAREPYIGLWEIKLCRQKLTSERKMISKGEMNA